VSFEPCRLVRGRPPDCRTWPTRTEGNRRKPSAAHWESVPPEQHAGAAIRAKRLSVAHRLPLRSRVPCGPAGRGSWADSSGRQVLPRQRKCVLDARPISFAQAYIRTAAQTPSALYRFEDAGLDRDQRGLLVWLEFHHRPIVVRVPQCRKDAIAYAKVWVAHVGRLDRARKCQCESAKIIWGHSRLLDLWGGQPCTSAVYREVRILLHPHGRTGASHRAH
jgi:hypothetical protein